MNNSNSTESFKRELGQVSFNLSEFSFAPLSDRLLDVKTLPVVPGMEEVDEGSRLHSRRFEWEETREGNPKTCYFETIFPAYCPPINASLDDTLFYLAHLVMEQGSNIIEVNPTRILESRRGGRHRMGGKEIERIVADIQIGTHMKVATNYIYDPKKKKWKGVKVTPLAGVEYLDEDGIARKTRIEKDGQVIEIDTSFMTITHVEVSQMFMNRFLSEPIPCDVALLFSITSVAGRRLFRTLNKYVQPLFSGGKEYDFQRYATVNLGMNPAFFEKYRVSHGVSNLRRAISTVNDTGVGRIEIHKSKTPSGYKILFDRAVTQVSIPGFEPKYSSAEEKAIRDLKREGIFPQVAPKLVLMARNGTWIFKNAAGEEVVEKRNVFGKLAPDYIQFVLRRYRKWAKTQKNQKQPAILHTRLVRGFHEAEFFAWHLDKDRKARKKEDQMFKRGDGVKDMADLFAERVPVTPTHFSLSSFAELHAQEYAAISEYVNRMYSDERGKEFRQTPKEMKVTRDKALKTWCTNVWTARQSGDKDYLPDFLIGQSMN